jgi:hypothetical protein
MTRSRLTDEYECWSAYEDRESAVTIHAQDGHRAAEQFARMTDDDESDGNVIDVCVAERGVDTVITYAVRLRITWEYTAKRKS